MKEARVSPAALVVKEVLYIIGGLNLPGRDKPVEYVETMNLETKE